MINQFCPICNATVTLKKISQSYYKCTECSVIINYGYTPSAYSKDYFFDEYKQQYGKSYEDDFLTIYTSSLQRIAKIRKFLKKDIKYARLLDIGAALGFFCKAAKDVGFGLVEGVEVSTFACEYCRNKYSLQVHNSTFEQFETHLRYDVITAWFVIEHFADPLRMLQKIYYLLEPSGIFACTMPSYFGPLFYCKKDLWVTLHPRDHKIDVSPWGIKKILYSIGFTSVSCSPSGYHPERIGNFMKRYEKIYKWLSDICCFSDTIFVIAKK